MSGSKPTPLAIRGAVEMVRNGASPLIPLSWICPFGDDDVTFQNMYAET